MVFVRGKVRSVTRNAFVCSRHTVPQVDLKRVYVRLRGSMRGRLDALTRHQELETKVRDKNRLTESNWAAMVPAERWDLVMEYLTSEANSGVGDNDVVQDSTHVQLYRAFCDNRKLVILGDPGASKQE